MVIKLCYLILNCMDAIKIYNCWSFIAVFNYCLGFCNNVADCTFDLHLIFYAPVLHILVPPEKAPLRFESFVCGICIKFLSVEI